MARINDSATLRARAEKMLPRSIPAAAIDGAVPTLDGYWVFLAPGFVSTNADGHVAHGDTLKELREDLAAVNVTAEDPDLDPHLMHVSDNLSAAEAAAEILAFEFRLWDIPKNIYAGLDALWTRYREEFPAESAVCSEETMREYFRAALAEEDDDWTAAKDHAARLIQNQIDDDAPAAAADPEPAAEEAAADPELHYFDVAVEVAPGVYSCNLAVAETADDVSAHYAQTRPGCDVTITEVDDGEYAHDEARRRGKPVVICPHIIDAPAAEALATPTEAPAGNHSRTAPHDLAPIDRAAGLVLLDHLDALRRGNKMQSAEEALRFACAYVAEAIGVPSRSDWTGLLLQNPNTLYAEEFPVDSYRTRTGLDTPEYNRACAAGGYRERDILQRCTCWGNRDPRTVGGRNIREFWYVDADGRTVSADYDLDRHIWTN